MRALGVSSLLAFAACSCIGFVSCAESDTKSDTREEHDAAPSEDSGGGAGDAALDSARGPCAAGDPTCTAERLPCEATDFCPAASPVNARYALSAVWGLSANDAWAVGAAGTITHWDGSTWSLVESGTTYTLNAIAGSGADDVWVVSTPDVVLHRRDGGFERVTPVATGTWVIPRVLLRAIWIPPAGGGIVVAGDALRPEGTADEHQVWTTPAEAIAWTARSRIERFDVRGVWGSSADDVWIVGQPTGASGMALHGALDRDGGLADFTPTDIQASNVLNAVWGSSKDDVWAVGSRGTIRHFDPGASRWEIVPSPTTQDLHAIWGSGPSDAWIAGDGGTLLHWDGKEWTRLVASFPVGRNPNLYGIWGSGPNDVWAVGEQGTILHAHSVRSKSQGGEP